MLVAQTTAWPALAQRNGLTLPYSDVAAVKAAYDFTDLTSFLAVYYPAMGVLQTADDFHDLAWAYLLRAKEQGVVHAELFFDPQAHTGRGIPFATVIGGSAVDGEEPAVDHRHRLRVAGQRRADNGCRAVFVVVYISACVE